MRKHNRKAGASVEKAEIDIHNLTTEQAKHHLELYLNRLEPNVKEVSVIHGYSRGTALRDMVRKRLSHHRIKSKFASLNPGETIIILK
jgi:DNA-nicking Smr family endonuclease